MSMVKQRFFRSAGLSLGVTILALTLLVGLPASVADADDLGRVQLVTEVYNTELCREPDSGSIDGWAHSGLSREELQVAFAATPENPAQPSAAQSVGRAGR